MDGGFLILQMHLFCYIFMDIQEVCDTFYSLPFTYLCCLTSDICTRLGFYKALHEHLKCNILCFDYRGYGCSDPFRVTHEGIRRDSDAALAFATQLLKDQKGSQIFLYGHSMGGGIASYVASSHPNEVYLFSIQNDVF